MDNDYAKEITKQAVARACVALDIKTVRSDCIDIVADVIRYYIRTVALGAREAAENSGRAYAGIHDIIRVDHQDFNTHWKILSEFAFDNLSSSIASEAQEQNENSTQRKWNHPFPVDIDQFPEEESAQTFEIFDLNEDNVKKESFVPSHLPSYPPSHTIEKKGSGSKRKQSSTSTNNPNKKIAPEIIKNASNIAAKIEEAADSIVSDARHGHHGSK